MTTLAKNVAGKSWNLSVQWNGNRYSESADVPAFTAPSSLSVTPSGATNALSWTNGTASAQTLIYRSTAENGTYAQIGTANAAATTYNDDNLANGTYWYKVQHTLNSVLSDATAAVSGTIGSAPAGASLTSGVLTLTGTGFPTKSRAAPIWWDDFSTASEGSSINLRYPLIDNANGTDQWSGTYRGTGTRPYATLSGSRVSGKPSARHDFTDSNYNCSVDVRHSLPDAQAPVYLSFWWKSTPIGGMRQIKPFVVYGNRPNTDNQYPQFYVGMGNYEALPGSGLPSYDAGWRTATIDSPRIPDTAVRGLVNWDAIQGRFVRIEMCLVQSDQNTANGMYACRLYDPDYSGGARQFSVLRQNFITRNTGGAVWRQFAFGHYADNASGYSMGTCPVYTDDIYIDDSEDHARVVLGNSSDYASCTRVEDQPATAWSGTSISCTYNKGGFTSGQTAYAFIVTGAGHSGHGTVTYVGSVAIP